MEQNYKNFNKYKDNFYNKLHSRYNNKIPPINDQKLFLKEKEIVYINPEVQVIFLQIIFIYQSNY